MVVPSVVSKVIIHRVGSGEGGALSSNVWCISGHGLKRAVRQQADEQITVNPRGVAGEHIQGGNRLTLGRCRRERNEQ